MATEKVLRDLGGRVQRRREARGLTIDGAAEIADISPVTWSRVEKGLTVRRLSYAAVDRALGWRDGACVDFLEHGVEPGPAAPESGRQAAAEEDEFARLDRALEEWRRVRRADSERDRERAVLLETLIQSWRDRDAG